MQLPPAVSVKLWDTIRRLSRPETFRIVVGLSKPSFLLTSIVAT